MNRTSTLIAITSLTLVVGLTLVAWDWLRVPTAQPDAFSRNNSGSSKSVAESALPSSPAPSNPAPLPDVPASRIETQSSVVIILDRSYDDDSPLTQSAVSLQEAILEALLPNFRESKRVVAEDHEVAACGPSVGRMLNGALLDGRDPKLMNRSAQHDFSVSLVLEWKTERELFNAFGGRVTRDDLGRLTAVGARASFLKEQHAKGAFKINDTALSEQFWRAIDDNSNSTNADVTDFDFTRPWWSKPRR